MRYSSYSFPTSDLDGGEWSASRLGRALAPEKEPSVPIVQEAGWAPEPVRTQTLGKKVLSPLLGIDPRSSSRPARSQTLSDWATRLFTSRYSYSNWCLRWACFQKTVFRCSAAFLSKNLKCSSVLFWHSGCMEFECRNILPGLILSFESLFKQITHSSIFSIKTQENKIIFSIIIITLF
jgi:hypothetical protein